MFAILILRIYIMIDIALICNYSVTDCFRTCVLHRTASTIYIVVTLNLSYFTEVIKNDLTV